MLEKKKEEEKKLQTEDQMEEISGNQMDQVNGAGNPFKNIPRVPTQPIDDDLRYRG